jgi:hypothetical protein
MSDETPVVYNGSVLEIASIYEGSAANFGQTLGVSAQVILGAILEEYNDQNVTWWQAQRAELSELVSYLGNGDHAAILAGYEYVSSQTPEWRANVGFFDKTQYPVLVDVGLANIKIYTAIGLLKDYTNRFPQDPFDLFRFSNDYAALARALANPYDNATVAFAGLMVDQGLRWGAANISNWSSLSEIQKQGYAVFFYNVGLEAAESRRDAALAQNGVYNVDIGATLIAQEYILNHDAITQRLIQLGEWSDLSGMIRSGVLNGTYCFSAGTPILLPDGTTRPIETILPGDVILSYDASGTLVPGRVTRTFRNEVSHLLDVHGLKVTPGHATLCGDGMFKGCHVPIIDILLSDGALVQADGTLIRMAINAPVGSRADAFVKVAVAATPEDMQGDTLAEAEMRVGTLLFDREGVPISVLDCLTAEGYAFDPETGLIAKPGEAPHPLFWFGRLPRPEDYILTRSRETLEGILVDGEWEGSRSALIMGRLRRTIEGRVH